MAKPHTLNGADSAIRSALGIVAAYAQTIATDASADATEMQSRLNNVSSFLNTASSALVSVGQLIEADNDAAADA